MIRYDLKCENDHSFDMWFRDSETFTSLKEAGMMECPDCGSAQIEKLLMAPSLPAKSNKKNMISGPRAFAEHIREYRKQVFANTDDVGKNFPAEARQMHDGEIEHRPIRGEASPEEAKELSEDGVEIFPVPPEPPKEN